MLMKILWNYIDSKSLTNIRKQKLFLLLHIIMWALLSLFISLFIGWIRGLDGNWIELAAIIIGYATFGIGFLGGFIYLSNRT